MHIELSREPLTQQSPAAGPSRITLLSVPEGALATLMGVLTSGVFLTGFGLALGANRFQIGLLSSLPFLANFAQLAASHSIERTGERKRLCLIASAVSRILWIGLIVLIFLPPLGSIGPLVALGIVIFSTILANMAGVCWLSWIKDLLPPGEVIRFFTLRSAANTAVGLTAGLLGGVYLEYAGGPRQIESYTWIFLVALISGLLSLPLLQALPDRPMMRSPSESIRHLYLLPWRQTNFRRVILFFSSWSLATQLATPFLFVFMLDRLHLSMTMITILAAWSSMLGLASHSFWMGFSQRFGIKPALTVGLIGEAFLILAWIFVEPPTLFLLPFLHAITLFSTPLNVGAQQLVTKLCPTRSASAYMAVFQSTVGASLAIGGVLGGVIAQSLVDYHYSIGWIEIGGLKVLFLLSTLARWPSFLLLRSIQEPAADKLVHVLRLLHRSRLLRKAKTFRLAQKGRRLS